VCWACASIPGEEEEGSPQALEREVQQPEQLLRERVHYRGNERGHHHARVHGPLRLGPLLGHPRGRPQGREPGPIRRFACQKLGQLATNKG
jgi:hypothetical protein